MTTILTIHKFESDIQIQTKKITIQDDDTNSITYSDWIESSSDKQTNLAKTSRLVVKLVSSNETNHFNLDYCAKKTKNCEIYKNPISADTSQSYGKNQYFNTSNKNGKENNKQTLEIRTEKLSIMKTSKNSLPNIDNTSHSPLEYNLEKVNEINARIMENIHLLNRTLSYTKEKAYIETKTLKSFPCPTCGKCFVYETGLRRHCSIRHSLGQSYPRWQIVWTCMECYQVWPLQDLAYQHFKLCCKTPSDEGVNEIKTSLLLQCEFCEKVFTSIPRLLKHSKGHTTANNYECTSCTISFVSYKEAEHHWDECLFIKKNYIFSLLKMFFCNYCDRKFKNYEQLYTHRYKLNHFTTKFHTLGCDDNLGKYMYQCEVCGNEHDTITELLNHRYQVHPPCDYTSQNIEQAASNIQ